MSVVVIVLLALFLIDAKIAKEDTFWEDYCSVAKSNALKGIFVMMVFLSHFQGYIQLGEEDQISVAIVSFLGQLMVAPFLFFSGFGIMESIRKKGNGYVKKIPVQRVLKTWTHFVFCVFLFWILNLLLDIPMSVRQMALSLVCWESVGNSTWYIFTMLFLYLFTAVSFLIFRKNAVFATFAVTLLTFVYVLIIRCFQDSWWYNTSLCYSFGMWFALLRDKVEKLVQRSDVFYCSALLLAFYGFRQLMRIMIYSEWFYQFYAMAFVMLVVGVSMKLRLDNPMLQFLGKHTFTIYMLQRLPMCFMQTKELFVNDHITMFVMCFLMTCILAIGFDKFLLWFDKRVFLQRVKV